MSNDPSPKRFYLSADTAPADDGFSVRLDGRVVRSPQGRPLVAPTEALAGLIAAEWTAQGATVDLANMPATRLAHTALDGVGAARGETVAALARYAGSDLICYFAEAPRALVERQMASWSPLLDWARRDLDLRFDTTVGIVHRTQPPKTLARVATLASALDDFALSGLAFGAALFGSTVIALALRLRRLDAAGAVAAASLDEAFQQETWGVDAQAAQAAQRMARDAAMLQRWFAALS